MGQAEEGLGGSRRAHLKRLAVVLAAAAPLAAGFVALPHGAAASSSPTPVDSFTVNGNVPSGGSGTVSLEAGTTYALSVTGTVQYVSAGQAGDPFPTIDANCYYSGAGSAGVPATTMAAVYGVWVTVDGQQLSWQPADGSPTTCALNGHSYTALFTPTYSGVLTVAVHDSYYPDNSGQLQVQVFPGSTLLPPGATQIQQVVVPGNSASGASSLTLLAGQQYILEATGVYTWGQTSGDNGDAACSTTPADPTWSPDTSRNPGSNPPMWSLTVQGRAIPWAATLPDTDGCNSTTHTYRVPYVPAGTGPVTFSVSDTYYGDNSGALTVTIYQLLPQLGTQAPPPAAGPPPLDSFTVDGASPSGGSGAVSLQAGVSYQLAVSGLVQYVAAGSDPLPYIDAACYYSGAGTVGTPATAAEATYGVWVAVDGQQLSWQPTDGSSTGCALSGHAYTAVFTPTTSGVLNVAVHDSWYGDNSGQLQVQVFPGGGAVPPGAVQIDTVTVPGNSEGVASTASLIAGQQYVFQASGVYAWDPTPGDNADALCSTTSTDPVWKTDGARNPGYNPPLWSLLAENRALPWSPTIADANSCNSSTHVYGSPYTPPSTGPVTFRVNDTYVGDNSGALTVKIYELAPQGSSSGSSTPPNPIDSFAVPGNTPSGGSGSVTLQAGTTYAVVISGTVQDAPAGGPDPFNVLDANCYYTGAGVAGIPTTAMEAIFGSWVSVAGEQLTWQPNDGSPTGCAVSGHSYTALFTPTATGVLNVAFHDTYYGDNSGTLQVEVFPGSTVLPPGAILVDTVTVPGNSSGTTSNMALVSGRQYLFQATGMYTWSATAGDNADASCGTTSTDPVWRTDQSRNAGSNPPLWSLVAQGQALPWAPTLADSNSCNTTDHTYNTQYAPATTGQVTFKVVDTYYGDNGGALTVRIYALN